MNFVKKNLKKKLFERYKTKKYRILFQNEIVPCVPLSHQKTLKCSSCMIAPGALVHAGQEICKDFVRFTEGKPLALHWLDRRSNIARFAKHAKIEDGKKVNCNKSSKNKENFFYKEKGKKKANHLLLPSRAKLNSQVSSCNSFHSICGNNLVPTQHKDSFYAERAERNQNLCVLQNMQIKYDSSNPKYVIDKTVKNLLIQQQLETLAAPESGQVIKIDNDKITLRRAHCYFTSEKGVLSVVNNEYIKKGNSLFNLKYEKLLTGDIVQGLGKIEELLEHPKLSLNLNFKVCLRRYLTKVSLNKAIEWSYAELQGYLVEAVQQVYVDQGCFISDKHLEIIVRQATSLGIILFPGDTGFLHHEVVAIDKIEKINKQLINSPLINRAYDPFFNQNFIYNNLLKPKDSVSELIHIYNAKCNTIFNDNSTKNLKWNSSKSLSIYNEKPYAKSNSCFMCFSSKVKASRSAMKTARRKVATLTSKTKDKIKANLFLLPFTNRRFITGNSHKCFNTSSSNFLNNKMYHRFIETGLVKKTSSCFICSSFYPLTPLLLSFTYGWNKVSVASLVSKPRYEKATTLRSSATTSIASYETGPEVKSKICLASAKSVEARDKSKICLSKKALRKLEGQSTKTNLEMQFIFSKEQKGAFPHFKMNAFGFGPKIKCLIYKNKQNSVFITKVLRALQRIKNSNTIVETKKQQINNKKQQKALYYPHLKGITWNSLNSDSILSSASFQETRRVLRDNLVTDKVDFLKGIKERIILGELLEIGTGFYKNYF